MVALFIVGFGLWAIFAPLESAAIAGGEVEAETSRKTIQHLEGGIVAQILVKDGDRSSRPAAGQARRYPGARLGAGAPGAAARSRGAARRGWRRSATGATASSSRCRSGRRGATDPAAGRVLAGQTTIFVSRRQLHLSRLP